jgi:predicted amidohydrolase
MDTCHLGGFAMSDPTDPAAVFMKLYDQLPEDVFAQREALRWERDPQVKRDATRVYEHILGHGLTDPRLTAKIVQGGGNRERFAVLRGIDWALEHVNPFDPVFDQGNLAWLAERYAEHARLNGGRPETEGLLLPRCAYPGRPRGTNGKSLYFGLNRVSPECMAKVRYDRIDSKYEPYFRPDQQLPVGCAPLLESFDDVRIDFFERDGESVYTLAPLDSESLRERISQVIKSMDDSGARIGVMPEGTLTDDLLAYWKQVAYETAALDKPLRWLLVGSGPLGAGDPPPNRAVLLDRWTGETLLEQDKLAGFTLTREQATAWNLLDRPVKDSAAEYMAWGSTISVRESSLGRLAVLICEDLNQSVGWERELVACGISHLLVPIFSKPIMHYRWEQTGAEREVNNMGAWLVIANSLVIQRAMDAMPQNEDQYTCLIAGPRDADRASYLQDLQFGAAEAGDDLGKRLLDGVPALPAMRAASLLREWLGNGSPRSLYIV